MSVRRARVIPVLAAIAVVILVAGPAIAARVTVAVVDLDFVAPGGGSTVTIDPGDTVVWRAQGIGTDHTVTGGERGSSPSTWLFDVTFSKSGDRFEWTYAEPGSYSFFCQFHGGMDGTVVVRGAPASEAPGPSGTSTPTPTPTGTLAPNPSAIAPPSPVPTPTGAASPGASPTPGPSAGPSAAPPTPPADEPGAGDDPGTRPHEPRAPITAEARIAAVAGLVAAALVLLGLTSLYRRVNR